MEVEKMMSTPPSGRNRQSYGVGNWTPDLANSTPASTAGSEYGGIEFTREDIEALLTEKMRCKSKFNYKERFDNMNDYIKRLKLCIKWFLELETEFAYEQEKLRNALELTERRCDEMEGAVKKKEDELNFVILELRESLATAKEQLAKEEAEKLAAMDTLVKEKEDRINFEKEQASLAEELGKVQGDLAIANQKVASVNDMYKLLQEYNSSMQVYNNKLQADIDMAIETTKRIEKEKETIIENLGNLRGQYTSIQEQLTLSKASHDEAMKQKNALMNEVANVKTELQQVKEERDRLKLEVQHLAAEIAASKEVADNSNELEAKCLSQDNQIQMLLSELAIAERKLKMSDISALEARAECEAQKKLISEMQNRLDDAEFKVKEGERLRKAMHNTILELKGNIRVFCRVRPLLSDESSSNQGKVLSFPSSMETQGRAIDFANNGQKHNFTFDKVFTPEASQEEVFVEISQLVQSALDGYKVCIFAYGQTGSGKTHTMMGRPGDQDEKGLIPRSLEQIFQTKQALRSHGWKYEMRVSMLEIYNETIRDLLSTNQDASRAENGSPSKQYAIKHDANGSTHVSDLTIVDVQSTREVSYLLDRAARSRSVGKTQMNEQSSRSHLVFTMRISGVNETTDQHVQGVLNLIDLAGSERLSKSGSTGDRLRETQAINKSLSSLADVIFALAKKEEHAHVPFRNSKLTYLLQPCLGGDSKTLMFVNISPEDSSAGESLCSLRFAARVNACDIGPPRRQSNIRTESGRFSYG